MAGARAALRGLLPGLLMAGGEQTAELTARERAVVREHALRFVLFMVEEEGESREAAQGAAALLVQHLAAKVPDKADWRREAASAILRLLAALPEELLQQSLRWLLRYFVFRISYFLSRICSGSPTVRSHQTVCSA